MGPFSASLSTEPFEANSLHLGYFLIEVVRLLLENLMQLVHVLSQGKWPLS